MKDSTYLTQFLGFLQIETQMQPLLENIPTKKSRELGQVLNASEFNGFVANFVLVCNRQSQSTAAMYGLSF